MTVAGRSRRRIVVASTTAVAILATGALLVRISRAGIGSDERPEPLPVDDGQSGQRRENAPAEPVEFRFVQTEQGASMTAVGLAASAQRWLYLTDDKIRSSVEAIAASDARGRLADEVLGEIQTARHDLAASSGRIWWFVQPLAWRVDRYSDVAAEVSVWFVTILSAADVAIPQTAWRTGTFDLVWTDGAWRLEAMNDLAGPTPATGPDDDPWDAEVFDDALTGFTRLDQAARP